MHKAGYSQRFAETFGRAGHGIGQAIAREIIERHQDRIVVSCEGVPGQGATPTVAARSPFYCLRSVKAHNEGRDEPSNGRRRSLT